MATILFSGPSSETELVDSRLYASGGSEDVVFWSASSHDHHLTSPASIK